MPTSKSNVLLESVVSKLKNELSRVHQISGSPRIFSINGRSINVRVTTKKAGTKFWFDVTPDLYDKVQFFIYACGSSEQIYIIPSKEFAEMLAHASVGGINQVPNFTIFTNTHELEPAGQSHHRFNIQKYYNKYSLIT